MEASIGDVARHFGESSQGVDRVEVAEEENGLAMVAAGEIDLDVVGVVFGAMDTGASTESFEAGGEQGAHTVGGEFVVTGGFELNEFADRLDECVVAGGEVLEAVVPVDGGVRGGGR